jgi:hypothetical protein
MIIRSFFILNSENLVVANFLSTTNAVRKVPNFVLNAYICESVLEFIYNYSSHKFAKFVSIRKEAIHTVPYEVYSMLWMFYRQENPGVTCAKNLRKGTKPKIREILSPHFSKAS